jgi:arginine/lysine/ornithine decarboxylase
MFSDKDLIKNINLYSKLNRVPFHTPMHLGRTDYPNDLSELSGLDNLQYPSSTLKNTEEYLSEIFSAKKSFLLTNGASIGLQAAILALKFYYLQSNLALKPLLVARNVHKSVLSGIILAGFDVEWLELNYDHNLDLYTGLKLSVAELKDFLSNREDDYAGLVLTNPSYDGFYSDLSSLKSLTLPLIIDEAHGTHYYFSGDLPQGALKTAGDIVIHSLHKTLGALTQSAVAHISLHSKVPASCYEAALRLLQTTSPSYLILKSILESVQYYAQEAKELYLRVKAFQEKISSNHPTANNDDYFRIVIQNARAEELEVFLEKRNIFIEKKSSKSITIFLSPYHNEQDIDLLNEALTEFQGTTHKHASSKQRRTNDRSTLPSALDFFSFPDQALNPQLAYFSPFRELPYQESLGEICAELFAPCPPGFPLLVPGQKINSSIIDKLGICNDFLRYKRGIIRVVE